MRHFLLNGNFSYIPFALRDLSFEVYFLSKIGLKKKTKMKETSFRRKKFLYYKRIKIKGTFCGPTVRCEEQLKAFTVNSRQCCQLVSICALGYTFLSEATFRHQRFKHLKKRLTFLSRVVIIKGCTCLRKGLIVSG